jgi:hypothetical protein
MAHALALHTSSTPHAWAQAPQLAASRVMSSSQPSEGSPPQLPQPTSHVAIAQAPFAHLAVPFSTEHALRHRPQLATSLVTSTSQPSLGLPLQSTQGVMHALSTQWPPRQLAEAWGAHTSPQPPQLFRSVPVSTHAPLPHVSQPRENATVQSKVIKPVVYTSPAQLPAGQVPPTVRETSKVPGAVIVKVWVAPESTSWAVLGSTVTPVACGVTVKSGREAKATSHDAVMGPVV